MISGIVHVLRSGCRWQDTPSDYGPPTTVYNRFHRWSQRGIWQGMFTALAEATPGGVQAIDSTAEGATRGSRRKRGPKAKPSGAPAAGAGSRSMP